MASVQPQRDTAGMQLNYSLKDLQDSLKKKKKKKLLKKIASSVPWRVSSWMFHSLKSSLWKLEYSIPSVTGSSVLRQCCTDGSEPCFRRQSMGSIPTPGQQQFSAHVPWASWEPWQTEASWHALRSPYTNRNKGFICSISHSSGNFPPWRSVSLEPNSSALEVTQVLRDLLPSVSHAFPPSPT